MKHLLARLSSRSGSVLLTQTINLQAPLMNQKNNLGKIKNQSRQIAMKAQMKKRMKNCNPPSKRTDLCDCKMTSITSNFFFGSLEKEK